MTSPELMEDVHKLNEMHLDLLVLGGDFAFTKAETR
jgi:hypothetical protein